MCPTTVADGEPAKCPESLCPVRVCPPRGRRSFRLLRGHYSSFFAPTDSFASRSGLSSTSVYALVGGVFAGCHQPLLPAGPSRCYLRESFLGSWIPYPGGPTACAGLFLPLCHRPSPQRAGSASRE